MQEQCTNGHIRVLQGISMLHALHFAPQRNPSTLCFLSLQSEYHNIVAEQHRLMTLLIWRCATHVDDHSVKVRNWIRATLDAMAVLGSSGVVEFLLDAVVQIVA